MTAHLGNGRLDHAARRIMTRLVCRVLDLDVDQHLAARRQHLTQLGVAIELDGVRRQWIVFDDQPAVGRQPHIEFDAVGTHCIGEHECLHGVLRGSDRGAAMSR